MSYWWSWSCPRAQRGQERAFSDSLTGAAWHWLWRRLRPELDGDRISAATIVLGAVAPVPLVVHEAPSLLVGEVPSKELFDDVALACAETARPISDIRGSADFRRALIGVLARRALEQASMRARGHT